MPLKCAGPGLQPGHLGTQASSCFHLSVGVSAPCSPNAKEECFQGNVFLCNKLGSVSTLKQVQSLVYSGFVKVTFAGSKVGSHNTSVQLQCHRNPMGPFRVRPWQTTAPGRADLFPVPAALCSLDGPSVGLGGVPALSLASRTHVRLTPAVVCVGGWFVPFRSGGTFH